MATVGFQNQGIKVNGSVSVNGTFVSNLSGTLNLYTAPSTGYSIVNLHVANSATPGTVTFFCNSKTCATNATANANLTILYSLYVGPGQVISVSASGSGGSNVSIYGVEFINSLNGA